jgi:uncharacterized protein YjeT (DUF2065 family)
MGGGLSEALLAALSLMLVVEGLLPFLSPTVWRQLFTRMLAMSDGQIRFVGLTSMVIGLLSLVLIWR